METPILATRLYLSQKRLVLVEKLPSRYIERVSCMTEANAPREREIDLMHSQSSGGNAKYVENSLQGLALNEEISGLLFLLAAHWRRP